MTEQAPPQRVWQRMLSGRRLDILEPSPLDIEIEDIAHGLARVARWNGQTLGEHSYSVAQHSLAVLNIFNHFQPRANAKTQLAVLLHDAPEYVIGDMISPFKAVLGNDYKVIESRLQEAVHLRFGITAVLPKKLKDDIKRADLISAFFEATEIAGFDTSEAERLFGRPRNITQNIADFTPQPINDVKSAFLNAFERLDRLVGLMR